MVVSLPRGGPVGEQLDFDALFLGHARRVVRLAALLGADDPEDVAQEAFCRLYAARERLEDDGDRVVAYLNRIVVNDVRSRARRAQTARRSAHLLAVPAPGPGMDGERRAVVEELRRLPPRQREALVLRFWLDLPLAGVADAMGVRLGTAKSSVSRGLATLEVALADHPHRDQPEHAEQPDQPARPDRPEEERR